MLNILLIELQLDSASRGFIKPENRPRLSSFFLIRDSIHIRFLETLDTVQIATKMIRLALANEDLNISTRNWLQKIAREPEDPDNRMFLHEFYEPEKTKPFSVVKMTCRLPIQSRVPVIWISDQVYNELTRFYTSRNLMQAPMMDIYDQSKANFLKERLPFIPFSGVNIASYPGHPDRLELLVSIDRAMENALITYGINNREQQMSLRKFPSGWRVLKNRLTHGEF
ncbi:MAG: hypothetical protein INR69_00445 [Mucilaginibacter polytrichastri]|nr:hypothetical protein [Mucilaginibacter polytrichastri]